MKGLKYLFTVPKGEKVTEKHMVRVLISSVCGILLSMACLVSTTWAWFTVSITSTDNQIEVGTVFSSVQISTGDEEFSDVTLPCTLDSGTYQIRITNTGNTNGYFRLSVADNTGEEKSVTTPTIVSGGSVDITLMIQSGTAELTIVDYWGIKTEEDTAMEILAGSEPVIETEPVETTPSAEESTDPSEGTEPSTETTEPEESTAPSAEPTEPEESTAPSTEPTEPEESTAPSTESTKPEETTVPPSETTAPEGEENT